MPEWPRRSILTKIDHFCCYFLKIILRQPLTGSSNFCRSGKKILLSNLNVRFVILQNDCHQLPLLPAQSRQKLQRPDSNSISSRPHVAVTFGVPFSPVGGGGIGTVVIDVL